jgi:hypothetical protein
MNVVHSIGPPPDRYANRIVGTMLRELAKQRARNTDAIMELFYTSNDGSPAAQQRLAKRIEAAGAMHIGLTPGKRGKYQIVFYDMTGWDVGREKEVLSFDPAPDDANICLVVNANMLTSLGNGRNVKDVKGRRVLLISKHVLVRLVQRFDARTPADLFKGAENITNAALELAGRLGLDEFFEHEHRIEMTEGATLVLKPDDKRQVMIAMTIFKKGEG